MSSGTLAIELEYSQIIMCCLKHELKKAKLTYARLSEILTRDGLPISERAIACKINNGNFSVIFAMAVLDACGRQSSWCMRKGLPWDN